MPNARPGAPNTASTVQPAPSPALSYEVGQAASSSLQRLDRTTQPAQVHEPDTGWWLRAITRAMSRLPVEAQL